MYDILPSLHSSLSFQPANKVAIIIRTIPRLNCVRGSNEKFIAVFFHYTPALIHLNVQEQFQE